MCVIHCMIMLAGSSGSCAPSGIFREVAVSRQGAYSCPVASGLIFAVNVSMRGDAGAPLGAYSQALLASMQACLPSRQSARSHAGALGSMAAKQMQYLARHHVCIADIR